MKTTRLLNNALPSTGAPVYSYDAGQTNAQFYTDRIRDKTGAVQMQLGNSTDAVAVNLLGRMKVSDPWFSILTLTQADVSASNLSVIKVVTLYPIMAVKAARTGTATQAVNFWIVE